MLRNHPREEVALKIQLMRSEIAQVLKAQQKDPCKTPQESLAMLDAISVATRTIGTLVKSQAAGHIDRDTARKLKPSWLPGVQDPGY